MNHLIHFTYEYDHGRLLLEANDPNGYVKYCVSETNYTIDGWHIKRCSNGYAMEINNHFKNLFNLTDCKPRFYIQEPGFDIGFHTDQNTLCSFNFVLSNDPDPISFTNFDVIYNQALLNTQVKHAVLKTKSKRILFKISVFDKSFEEIARVLPSKLNYVNCI